MLLQTEVTLDTIIRFRFKYHLCIEWCLRSRPFVFTARRYAYSAVFAVARCLSVTLVHYSHTAEDIVKLLSQPDSPIILVF